MAVTLVRGNQKYEWHILGLGKTEEGFVIKSQFPIRTEGEFYKKISINKKIYHKKVGRL
jgi:hypothetical protein